MSTIDRVEVVAFAFDVPNLSLGGHSATGVGNMIYERGAVLRTQRFAVRIRTADGACGEYVTHWVGTPATLGQAEMLAPHLVGRDAEHRQLIYDDLKRELRSYDHMAHGAFDIALWDLAGKQHGASVAALLGGFRTHLPTYASTYLGQEEPGGLNCPEAYADYAEACKEHGFHGFKIHGWHHGDAKLEARNVLGVRERVGPDWKLMIDPANELRTFLDALYVGRACDEADFFWYEDPYRDGGTSSFGHRRLRERLRTPLLTAEHVRGVEQKAAFVLDGGCDILHADPEYDMGITGTMKIAAFCEALGMDVQLHGCGPAHRAVMAALSNTHLYELALSGPDMPNSIPPVYLCGYSDQPDALPADGCVRVPDGPGLGVTYDWELIEANQTRRFVFE